MYYIFSICSRESFSILSIISYSWAMENIIVKDYWMFYLCAREAKLWILFPYPSNEQLIVAWFDIDSIYMGSIHVFILIGVCLKRLYAIIEYVGVVDTVGYKSFFYFKFLCGLPPEAWYPVFLLLGDLVLVCI